VALAKSETEATAKELAEVRASLRSLEEAAKENEAAEAKDAELEAMAKSLAEAHEALRIAQENALAKATPATETSTELARDAEAEEPEQETAALQLASIEDLLASKTSEVESLTAELEVARAELRSHEELKVALPVCQGATPQKLNEASSFGKAFTANVSASVDEAKQLAKELGSAKAALSLAKAEATKLRSEASLCQASSTFRQSSTGNSSKSEWAEMLEKSQAEVQRLWWALRNGEADSSLVAWGLGLALILLIFFCFGSGSD
jgi:hypothetical protein